MSPASVTRANTISFPVVGGEYGLMELYRQILMAFGIEFHSYQIAFMIQKIREQILEIASRKVTPILIIDEAHLFKRNVFHPASYPDSVRIRFQACYADDSMRPGWAHGQPYALSCKAVWLPGYWELINWRH